MNLQDIMKEVRILVRCLPQSNIQPYIWREIEKSRLQIAMFVNELFGVDTITTRNIQFVYDDNITIDLNFDVDAIDHTVRIDCVLSTTPGTIRLVADGAKVESINLTNGRYIVISKVRYNTLYSISRTDNVITASVIAKENREQWNFEYNKILTPEGEVI